MLSGYALILCFLINIVYFCIRSSVSIWDTYKRLQNSPLDRGGTVSGRMPGSAFSYLFVYTFPLYFSGKQLQTGNLRSLLTLTPSMIVFALFPNPFCFCNTPLEPSGQHWSPTTPPLDPSFLEITFTWIAFAFWHRNIVIGKWRACQTVQHLVKTDFESWTLRSTGFLPLLIHTS